jgi:hypothetical protein
VRAGRTGSPELRVGLLAHGVGLAGPVADVSVERYRLARLSPAAGRSPVIVAMRPSFVERAGLVGPVTSVACRCQGGLVQRGGLLPVAALTQGTAHHGGNLRCI